MKPKSGLTKLIQSIRKTLEWLMVILFIVMFIIVTTNVFLRYAFNAPISWAGELSRYSFIGIIFTGAILAMKDNAHIGMENLVEVLPPKIRHLVIMFGHAVMAFFLIVFIIGGVRLAVINIDTKSSAMLISMAIPYFSLPIGGLFMLMELLLKVIGFENEEEVLADYGHLGA